MYLRYIKWNKDAFARPLRREKSKGVTGLQYYFLHKESGICFVKDLRTVKFLLASGLFLPAFEEYGLAFDENGLNEKGAEKAAKRLSEHTTAEEAKNEDLHEEAVVSEETAKKKAIADAKKAQAKAEANAKKKEEEAIKATKEAEAKAAAEKVAAEKRAKKAAKGNGPKKKTTQ